MPKLPRISFKIRRLVWLSSTASTLRPRSASACRIGTGVGRLGATRKHAVKWKVLPRPDLAFQPDPAPHQFRQPGRNRQPQARAAEPARGAVVALLEGREDPGLLVRRNAGTRVPHGEVQDHVLLGLRLTPDLQHDLPMFGELDGVAHQIDQDLAQARPGRPGPRAGTSAKTW